MAIKESIFRLYNSRRGSTFIGGLLGIIVFLILYEAKVLDVTYIDWILYPDGQDLAQHYFGWEFYRKSDWMFPLGLMDSLSYPLTSSVIFTDSIPHWALLFKIFSPVLPESFQYFGIYGLFCMFLQGAISALIIRELTENTTYALVASLFFIIALPLHKPLLSLNALSSQWLVLLALYLYLCKANNPYRTRTILWSILLWYSAGTHVTILSICCVILFFDVLKTISIGGMYKSLLLLSVPIIIAVGTLYLYGGLTSETNPVSTTNKNSGLGWYGANLNTLFNPIREGNSTFIQPLPISERTSGLVDGDSYLGVGGIILLLISFFSVWMKRSLCNKEYPRKNIVWTLIMVGVFSIIAISPRVTCGSRVLFEYHPPKLILWLWEVFRATDRYVWPIYYLVWISTIVIIHNTFQKKNLALVIVSLLFILQLLDVGPGINENAQSKGQPTKARESLSAQWYNKIETKDKICFCYTNTFMPLDYPELLKLAHKHNMKLNTFYFAHSYEEYDNKVRLEAKKNALSPNDETIYLFFDQPSEFIDSCRKGLDIFELDGYLVGIKSEDFNYSTLL